MAGSRAAGRIWTSARYENTGRYRTIKQWKVKNWTADLLMQVCGFIFYQKYSADDICIVMLLSKVVGIECFTPALYIWHWEGWKFTWSVKNFKSFQQVVFITAMSFLAAVASIYMIFVKNMWNNILTRKLWSCSLPYVLWDSITIQWR